MIKDFVAIQNLHRFSEWLVGFSGGLDSTVLLVLLAEQALMRSKITALHINHGLSPNANAWEAHCKKICAQLGVRFLSRRVTISATSNVEQVARTLRYEVFDHILTEKSCLLLAHQQDDQAETFLLQLFRGSGVKGLASMLAQQPLAKGMLFRPLLSYSRQEIYHIAKEKKLLWIEDESNQDSRFSRNFLRNEVLPLLHQRWPHLEKNILRTISHCQEATTQLQTLATLDCEEVLCARESLSFQKFLHLPAPRIINILRTWFAHNKILSPDTSLYQQIIQELLYAKKDATPCIKWGKYILRRYQDKLFIDTNLQKTPKVQTWATFPNPIFLKELFYDLEAIPADQGLMIPPDSQITIRFRQGGEKIFWHNQQKCLKKLFQFWKIPPWERNTLPLIFINGELASVPGYAIADSFLGKGEHAWQIQITTRVE